MNSFNDDVNSTKLLLPTSFKNNTSYRNYISNNKTIIDKNTEVVKNNMNYKEIQTNKVLHQPFLFNDCLDTSKPHGYESSDLKDNYLEKVAENATNYTQIIFRK